MKILVTGGAGFIGFHTCKELLKQGHEVVILDNLSTGKISNIQDLAHDELSVVYGDVTNQANLFTAMKDVDSIIHLAAKVSVRESVKTPSLTSIVNVQGFIEVLDQARYCGINRVVYASSAAVYGDIFLGVCSDECHPSNLSVEQLVPISPYGLDKLTDENYAALFNALYGMQTIGFRYFNVYGPRQDPKSQYAGVIGKFVSNAIIGEPLTVFGDGQQLRNYVYVEDIAKVNVAAATGQGKFEKFQGFLNVAKPNGEVTLNQLIQLIDQVLGKTSKVIYQEPAAGDIKLSQPVLKKFRETYANQANMHRLDDGLTQLVEFLKSR